LLSDKCKQDIAIAMFDMHDCTLEAKTKAITSESFCLRSFSHAGESIFDYNQRIPGSLIYGV
jgi:hypothetical protein